MWIQVHPLWIQGLKRLVLWTQNLTLLEGQGLWIQAIVLHCSCAKAASLLLLLSYLVLDAEAIEQLLDREKTMKWKPQTLQHTTTDDVKYLGVSTTQNYSSNLCNRKLLQRREYVSNMPSKSMPVDLAHVIRNDDHATAREEIERQQHCVVSKGDTIKDNIGLVCTDDHVGNDMIFACLVKKAGFEIENNAMHYHINMIRQDKSKQRALCRFVLKVSNGIKNMDE